MATPNLNDTTGPDPMAQAEEVPNIKALQAELQYAWDQDEDDYDRTAWKENIRYGRWANQADDGLKHDRREHRALPYDRCSDTRILLVDGNINGLVDVLYAAFFNARVQTAPLSAKTLSAAQAAEWRVLISWMLHGPLRSVLIDDVEFTANLMLTIGWCVLHPMWRKSQILRMTTISMQDVQQMAQQAAQQAPDTVLAHAVEILQDPEQEKGAIDLLRIFFPNLDQKAAGKAIRALRKNGRASFPKPEPGANVPEVAVLVPGQHFIMPPESTALGEMARWRVKRTFYSEQALRARALEEEWNETFVERVLATKGQAISNETVEHNVDDNLKDIEIFDVFQRRDNEDGVPGLYVTTLSMFVAPATDTTDEANGDYARHVLLDLAHEKYPFVFVQAEITGLRPMDSRGLPEIQQTQQLEMKNSRDGLFTLQQLSITPPLQKVGTAASKLPPELGPMAIINNPNGGEWKWFPPPMANPELAFKLNELVRKEAEDHAGLARGDTPPQRWQARQQRLVMRWLAKWGEVLWQLSVLAYQNLIEEELTQIIGRKPLLNADLVVRQQLILWFDVRALDAEWVKNIIESMSQFVLPADTGGNVDRAKWIRLIMSYLDPCLAEEVTIDEAGASQALFKQVRDEVGTVMQGNEAMYTENDPTAKAKLKFVQQVLTNNPEYKEQLTEGHPKFSPLKRERMEKYMKNLTQSATQQDNKVIGRLGVKPGNEPTP